MLGEMIGDGKGKIANIRVLPSEGAGPRMEVSFQGAGKLLGQDMTELGTYIATLMPNGVFQGAGQGLITTKKWRCRDLDRNRRWPPDRAWHGCQLARITFVPDDGRALVRVEQTGRRF